MTKNPIRIIIAVILIFLLITNLFNFLTEDLLTLNSEANPAETVGFIIGTLFVNVVIAVSIYLLLKGKRKNNLQ